MMDDTVVMDDISRLNKEKHSRDLSETMDIQ